MLLVFRNAGKSTLVGIFCAWLLLNDPDLRILVLAAEHDLARKMVRNVKRIIERHPLTRGAGAPARRSVGRRSVHGLPPAHPARPLAARPRHRRQHHRLARRRRDLRRRRGAEYLRHAQQAGGAARASARDRLCPGPGRPAALHRHAAQLLLDLCRSAADRGRRAGALPERLPAPLHSAARRARARAAGPSAFRSTRSRRSGGSPVPPSSRAR